MLKTSRKVTKISIKGAKLVNFHLSTIKKRIEIFIYKAKHLKAV